MLYDKKGESRRFLIPYSVLSTSMTNEITIHKGKVEGLFVVALATELSMSVKHLEPVKFSKVIKTIRLVKCISISSFVHTSGRALTLRKNYKELLGILY